MDANKDNLIEAVREIKEKHDLSWRHRCALAWVVALLMSGCAHDPWTKQDTTLQWIVTGTYVIDAIQTSDIQYRDDLYEGGPIAGRVLGPNPSTSDTWQYFATVSLSSYIISYYLPARWRPWWQGGQIAVQTKTIFSNCAHGLGGICEED